MSFLPTTHRVVKRGDEFLAWVDHAAELVGRCDGGLGAFAIPIDHSRRDLQLPKVAGFGAWEAKRGCLPATATTPLGVTICRVASYTVNERAVEKAKRLIESRQYVLNSEWGDVHQTPRPRTPISSLTPGTSTASGTWAHRRRY